MFAHLSTQLQSVLASSELVARLVAAAGLPADSPLPTFIASLLIFILPVTLVLATRGHVNAAVGLGSGGAGRYAAAAAGPKVILVTGASSGLGKLLLLGIRAAFPDAVVYGTSRTGWTAPAAGVKASDAPLGMRDDEGSEGRAEQPLLQLDVTSEESVRACVAAIAARHGRLDVLVNNAGTVVATWAKATTAADAESQMATNFFGMVRMVRACVPLMKDGDCRRVVNIGSIGGRIGLPYQSMYSASKAAVMVWTDALRMETWGEGIKVSLIESGDLKPGMVNAVKAAGFDANPVATGAFNIMREEEASGTDPAAVVRTVVRSLRAANPAGRYLVGPDSWLVEFLGRLCPHSANEYFLASHYRVPPRHNAWIRV